MAEALVKTGKHKVTALTRAESTNKIPDGVESKVIDYEHRVSLVEALRGQDVLIITMNVMAPRDHQAKLVEAAAEAKVPWVLPNEWGPDSANKEMKNDMMLGPAKEAIRKMIEQLGVSSWIGVVCGFWYEWSLNGIDRYGFDIQNRKAIFIDDGNARMNTSTWPQVGRAVASLLSLKVLPDDEHDNSPCLANFRNKFVYISSFLVNQREMLESIMRVTGTKIDDWHIEHQQHKERYESGIKDMKNGDRNGFARAMCESSFPIGVLKCIPWSRLCRIFR